MWKDKKPKKKRNVGIYDDGFGLDKTNFGIQNMAWIERIDKRNRKTKVFQDSLDSHKFQAIITIHDQHYKDDADTWQNVDESLVDDGLDNFAKKCDKTRHTIRLGNGGERRWYPRRDVLTEYVSITNIQYWRTTGGGSWRNINLPTPVWSGQGADWDMANLHATLTNTWKRIKAEFILKDATAPTRLRFAVSFVGLTYNATTGELTSTTDGLVWGKIDPPVAWYGDARRIDGTDLPITANYDGSYIEWSVDTTGAVYPVYVDPTFTDGYGGTVDTAKDTWLQWGSTDNYGTDETINNYEYNGGTDARRRSLLEFNLSSLSGVTVTSGTLTLVTDEWYYGGSPSVVAHRLLLSWVEAEATWALRSTGVNWTSDGCSTSGTDYDATAACAAVSVPSGANHAVDLTFNSDGITDLQNAIGGTVGFRISVSSGASDYCQFGSSDHATTGYRPKLVVVYTEGGTQVNVSDTAQGTDGAPTISASVSRTETGAGTDSQSIATSLGVTDSGSSSDAITLLQPASKAINDTGIGVDTTELSALLGLSDGALGGDFLDLFASLNIAEVAFSSETLTQSIYVITIDVGIGTDELLITSTLISGSSVWGQITGALETNIRTYANNWAGTGEISGSGDSEQICLASGQYMVSEVVQTGVNSVVLLQNEYGSGDTVLLQYRHGATEADCLSASWNTYSSAFTSLGYVQIRIESTL